MTKIKNPPNPTDPNFKAAIYNVSIRISLHLDNDLQLFLEFAMKVMGNGSLYNQRLMDIQQSQMVLREKCEKVLDLWARKSNSEWEDVITALREVGLSRLADELTKELRESEHSEQTQNSTVQAMEQTASKLEAVQRKPGINEIVLKEMYQKRNFEDEVIKTSTNMENLKKHTQQLRVLIETVNDHEYFAVTLQLKEGCEVIRYTEEGLDGSSYLVGEWGKAGIPVVIMQTHQGKDGPRGSYEETKRALERFPYLEYIFAVGVCGGVKGEVKLGDVVVSTVIQDYSTLKIKDGKWINRSPQWSISQRTDFHHTLTRVANNAKAGMVLSGNVLMADAVVQKDVLEASPDGIAFEMEGHGIAGACDFLNRNVVCMIVKGVSDHADKDKVDNWQPQAAMNAAEALCKAMEKYPKIGMITKAES